MSDLQAELESLRQENARLRRLLKPRVRSILRGMINYLLPIEVEVK